MPNRRFIDSHPFVHQNQFAALTRYGIYGRRDDGREADLESSGGSPRRRDGCHTESGDGCASLVAATRGVVPGSTALPLAFERFLRHRERADLGRDRSVLCARVRLHGAGLVENLSK
jgi:hypothetical protein